MIFLIILIVSVNIVRPSIINTNIVAARNHIGNIIQPQLICSISTSFKKARKKVKYIEKFINFIVFLDYG